MAFARGGSATAGVIKANLIQAGGQIAKANLATPAEISQAITVLDDPGLIMAMPMMVTAWGRKAPGHSRG